MSINPYIAGNPIGDDAGFYGRRDILRDVNQVLSHPQKNAIVLYGQRRIGKTSVLMQLERQLAEADRYTPVYFDLMDRAGKPLSVVLWELTRRISLTLNQPPPPREMFDEEGLYFRDTFLPDAAARAADGGLVLLFDEFDVLDGPTQEQAGAAFFPYLRSWMAQAAGVQFVFVIGRRPEDLSTHTISTFKGVKATHVGLLAQKEAQKVIRLAEENGSLHWPADAVATVWNWTKGHPFFTQLLCETIWNQAYEDEEAEDELPTVSPDLVTESLEPAMAAGANAFVWLWDGLPPAERVVMAAIAEAETELITGDDLVEILNRSGVRLIVSQLNLAPETLEEWGLLQRDDGGFRVTVPLLRLWVKKNRPLHRAKDELDRVDPLADRLFQTGQDFYTLGSLAEAQSQLQRALEINPNHLKARLLLGKILFEEEQIAAAIEILDEAYQYDARAARADLVRALLALAENEKEEATQLALYERILQLDRQQPLALEGQQVILAARQKRELSRQLTQAETLAADEKWAEAAAVYHTMLQEVDDVEWRGRLTQAEQEDTWQQKYTQALGAIETGNQETAQTLLAEIIAQRPDYKETARYLLLATKEVDAEILTDNNREQAAQLEMLTKEKEALEQQNEQLQAQVAKSESRRRLLAVGLTFLLVGLLLGSGMGWGARTTFGPLPTAVAVTITPTAPASVSTETIVTNTPSPTATPGTFAPPVVATLGMTWTRPTDSMAMVFVPGGTFTMGSGSGDADATDDEKPAHDVTLDPFWIDRTEVTNTQFAAFLNEMGNREEGGVTWLDSADEDVRIEDVDGTFQPQDGFADHPVVEVSWYGARAYCEWAGGDVISGTLPTEAQWEYTARGVDGFIYPWGDEFDATLVNYSGNSDFARTSPVGHFPDGASWVGALDMAGNVWEWTADWYDANYYDSSPEENPPGLEDGTFKVLRGGSWFNDQSFVRAAYRSLNNPDFTGSLIGFRCVVPPG